MISNNATLLDRLLLHEDAYWTTVSQRAVRDGWSLFYNPLLPTRYDPNHAGPFRAPNGNAAGIVAEVVRFYTERGLDPVAYVDMLAQPVDLAAQFEADGFRNMSTAEGFGAADLLIYIGPDRALAQEHPVAVVQTDEERAQWAGIIAEEATEPEQRELFRRLHQAEIEDPRVTAYLAYAEGTPAARCLGFSHGGITRVEVVRTVAAYQGRGLAAAVVRRAVADALERGDLAYLYAEQGGAAQRLYERLGFRTIARDVIRSYVYAGTTA